MLLSYLLRWLVEEAGNQPRFVEKVTPIFFRTTITMTTQHELFSVYCLRSKR
jgi:hypothetical protein